MEEFVQHYQEVSEKLEPQIPCGFPFVFVFLSKGKSGILKPFPEQFSVGTKMLQAKNVLVLLTRWICDWESIKTMKWIGRVLTWTTQNSSGLLVKFSWSLNWEQHPLTSGFFLERPDHFIYNKFQPWPLDQGGQLRVSRLKVAGLHCLRRYFRNVNGMPEWRPQSSELRPENCSCGHLLWPRKSHSNSFSRMVLFFFFFN